MFNIYGAAIASVACHMISFTISYIVLKRNMKLNINKMKFIVKPLIATIIMGISAILSYKLVLRFASTSIATIIAIGIAVIVYISLVLILKILEKEDYYMIPGGGNILKILQKLKIY